MGTERLRWWGACALALPLGCGGAPAEPKSAPTPASSATAQVPPPKQVAQPVRLRSDPTPLAYSNVSLPRSRLSEAKVAARGQSYALPVKQASLINLER